VIMALVPDGSRHWTAGELLSASAFALWLALAVFLSLRGLSLAVIWHRHWRNNTWFPAPHDIS